MFSSEDEIRYKKKKPSNTSKAKDKSNHKHHYVDVLCKYQYGENAGFISGQVFYCLGKKCTVCGKVKQKYIVGFREEIEKYKDLEVIDLGII